MQVSHLKRHFPLTVDEDLIHHGVSPVREEELHDIGDIFGHDHPLRRQVGAGDFDHVRIDSPGGNGVDTDLFFVTLCGKGFGPPQKGVL